LLNDVALVSAVCEDFESAPITEKEKALLRYVAVVNDTPAKTSADDVAAAKAAGWSDQAIFDALTVCGIFNFFNRWLDGAGIPDVPAGFYEKRLSEHGDMGYAM
jgi:alkylhydroperoxidase family enzyme